MVALWTSVSPPAVAPFASLKEGRCPRHLDDRDVANVARVVRSGRSFVCSVVTTSIPPRGTLMDKTPMPFMDISKLMEQFKIPGVDLGAVVEARRKDIEALTQANQQAYQGMQALAQRQAEILKETMSEWQTSMQGMMGKNPGDIAAKQVALATEAFEKALANMRELSEIASRSQIQALETVNKRFQENLQELRKLMQPK